MRTDPLFYELFQAAPQTFFELLQIIPACAYRFESITVKTSEKRIAGVFEPLEAGQPIYFLEVQAFPDEMIYWREMREIATFFEQRPAMRDTPWRAYVLWLNVEDDPGFGTLARLAHEPNPQLVSLDLIKLLKKLPDESLTLNVLRPLLAETEHAVRQNVVQWVEKIRQQSASDANLEERLISLMSQLIERKFKALNYKELSKMLRLTPLRETTSGQELLQEGQIAILSEFIQAKFSVSSELIETIQEEMQLLPLESLQVLARRLPLISTIEQLEVWISDHLPR